MKKIISLITVFCLCLTMISSLLLNSLAETSPVKTVDIDITQTPSFNDANNEGSKTVVSGKVLNANISFYQRCLVRDGDTPGTTKSDVVNGTRTWFPQYHLLDSASNRIPATVGDKVIVNITYKVTSVVSGDKGVQIGICPSESGNNNSLWYLYGVKRHLKEDEGKEFTLSTCYDVPSNQGLYANIAFSGGGSLEISSLNISILPKANISNYCVLKATTGNTGNWSFVKKGETLPAPAGKEYLFEGYYPNSDFSGNKISSISADTVVYPKWADDPVKKYDIDVTSQTMANKFSNAASSPSKAEVDGEKKVLRVTADFRNTYFSGIYENTGAKIWIPQYHLFEAVSGHPNAIANGSKVIVNITYKVTAIKSATEGIQIGIGATKDGNNNQVLHKNAAEATHKNDAIGQEFTLSASYTVASEYYRYPNIIFSGGGTVEISAASVYVLQGENADYYAILKSVDGNKENWSFVKKNTSLPTPEKAGYSFEGYYANAGFTGNKVTSVAADTTLYPKWSTPIRSYNIDLTQNPNNGLFQNSTYAASAAVKGNNLEITSNYTGGNKINNGSTTTTWLPNYGLVDSGKDIIANADDMILVNVVYKVTSATSGLSIGIGGWDNLRNNPVVIQTYKDHTSSDVGKEFSISAKYTCSKNNNNNVIMNKIKVAFKGVGSFEISEITVFILSPAGFKDYCTLTTVDDNITKSEFVVKDSELPTPKKEKYIFAGWYSNKEFTGSPVTTVSSNCTVYANWEADDGKILINYIDSLNNTNENKKYDVGDKIDVIPVNKDYNFLGWYKYENYLGKPVTTVTENMRKLYAKWEIKESPVPMYVDLTQEPQFVWTKATEAAGTTLSRNSGKIVVDVHNYERQLCSDTTTADTWYPSYVFKNSKGEYIALEKGTTYNLEVTYKTTKIRGGTGTGVQIGFGADFQTSTNRCRIKGCKMHDAKGDEGKEFTYSVTFKVDSNIYPRLLFSGDGIVEISKISIVKALPMVKDTVIGVQDYESYKAGADTGVIGDKKGTTVATSYNHTASGKNSLQLQIATNMARLSGNTIISLKQNGKIMPYQADIGSAYKITFYITSAIDMKDVVWNIGTASDTLLSDYIRYYTLETRGKIDIKAGKWQKVVAYISDVKGSGVANSYFDISVASNTYDGKNVYIDDVEIMQLLDSELITYDTSGGESLVPSRAFANQPILTLKEAKRADFLFDGWYYDKEYKKEAKLGDIFPEGKDELTLYAKWIIPNNEAVDFTAGSFDSDIYPDKKAPYTNQMENIDSEFYFEGNSVMTRNAVWMKDAGICGNGTLETDGAICLSNEFFSYRNDVTGYNAVRLMNADGTPFTVVKGGRYTMSLDYVCASSRAVAFLIPAISEQSAYGDFGFNTEQKLNKISVQATDSDYQTYTQSFVAEKTGYVYILLTGRDDNSHSEQHCYERICIDNVKINVDNDVVKLDYMCGSDLYFTYYGHKGAKVTAPNLLVEKSGSATVKGVYSDEKLTQEFNGFFPDEDSTCYIDLQAITYDTPSDFTKPISLSFEEKDLLKYFYNQSKFVTSWSRETSNEWIWVNGDSKNALSGNSYIQLNGFGHYWNEAKFALYDPNNPQKAMILSKGQKYRVSVMVRCIDPYEVPNGMYICLEKPSERFLLQNNGSYKLEYDPKGDNNGYYRFVGDIEVSEELTYLPTLAIRRAANDLQGLYIDDITVEQLKNCKVSYNANGGSAVEPIEVQIHDLAVDPGVPFRDGFVFEGWFTTSSLTKPWNFDTDTVERDMTLYAKWSVDSGEDEKPVEIKTEENDTVQKIVKVDNGAAPELLEADKVVINNDKVKTDTSSTEETSLPIWAIILIIAGGATVLAAGVILVIIFARKNKLNKR